LKSPLIRITTAPKWVCLGLLTLLLIALNSCSDNRTSRPVPANSPSSELYPELSPQKPETIQDQSGELKTNVPATEPVLVTIGGWNSCSATDQNPIPNPYGMNHHNNFSKMKTRIAQESGRPVRFVVACFTANMTRVRYFSSAAPEELREGPISHLFEEITRQVDQGGGQAFINGHSYGGWFAMQAALSLPSSVKVALLSTMDPISPVTCEVTSMASTASALIDMRLPPPNPGCNSSPTDMTTEQKVQIRSRVTHWENYFQTDFFRVLHASSIPEAHGNTEFKYPLPVSINGHIHLGLDADVWQNLGNRIEQIVLEQD
jgi:hypothetical protein